MISEEEHKTTVSGESNMEITPGDFVISRLELEEQQYVLPP